MTPKNTGCADPNCTDPECKKPEHGVDWKPRRRAAAPARAEVPEFDQVEQLARDLLVAIAPSLVQPLLQGTRARSRHDAFTFGCFAAAESFVAELGRRRAAPAGEPAGNLELFALEAAAEKRAKSGGDAA